MSTRSTISKLRSIGSVITPNGRRSTTNGNSLLRMRLLRTLKESSKCWQLNQRKSERFSEYPECRNSSTIWLELRIFQSLTASKIFIINILSWRQRSRKTEIAPLRTIGCPLLIRTWFRGLWVLHLSSTRICWMDSAWMFHCHLSRARAKSTQGWWHRHS